MSSCALVEGGRIKCWGTNRFGELGNGKQDYSAYPLTVEGL